MLVYAQTEHMTKQTNKLIMKIFILYSCFPQQHLHRTVNAIINNKQEKELSK